MNIEEIKNLAGAYSWLPIESKNKYMISFKHEETEARMNIYFTTMTITIQWPYELNKKPKSYKKVNSLEELENILCTP